SGVLIWLAIPSMSCTLLGYGLGSGPGIETGASKIAWVKVLPTPNKQSSVMPDSSDSIPVTATKIEINLSRLPQLFNSLDPSPFLERDLDRDGEDYIVGSAEEAPRQRPLALVIHLPADQLPAQGLPNLREAIHNYFAYRRDQEDRRLRLLFRDGRIAPLIGL